MKLLDLKENLGYREYQERNHYEEMLHQQLEQGGFGPVVDNVLNNLSEIQWATLIKNRNLLDAALDSYDHAEDSGESVGVSARDVAKAFIELGIEDVGAGR